MALLALGISIGFEDGSTIDHQVFALGQEFMQRRIEGADDNGEAVHRFEETGEVRTLDGQQLQQSALPARLFVTGENHGLHHERQAIFRKEHMFGAAKADTFGAELAGGLGVARNVGIGAHAELATELIGPAHELADEMRGMFSVGFDGVGLTDDRLRPWCRRREIQSPSFTTTALPPVVTVTVFLACRSIADVARTDDTGTSHTAGDYRRVAGFAADRGENTFGNIHAVNVIRRGLFRGTRRTGPLAEAIFTASSAVSATRPSDSAPGDAEMPVVTLVQDPSSVFGIENGVQELIELVRARRAGLASCFSDHAFSSTMSTAILNRGGPGALTVAGLQHVELLVLNGELEVLHVFVVRVPGWW